MNKSDYESPLIAHAKRELELIDEEEYVVTPMLEMIEIFSNMGHSGYSGGIFIHMLTRLLNFENLSQITDNPEDWILVGPCLYQNRRNGKFFSDDAGKTYYYRENNKRVYNFSIPVNNNPLHVELDGESNKENSVTVISEEENSA